MKLNNVLKFMSIFLVIFLVGCSASTENVEVDTSNASLEEVAEVVEEVVENEETLEVVEEEVLDVVEEVIVDGNFEIPEKYIKLEAEFACSLMGIEDQSQLMEMMAGFSVLLEKYELTLEDATVLKEKFAENEEFKVKIIEEISLMCPEKLANFDPSNFKLN